MKTKSESIQRKSPLLKESGFWFVLPSILILGGFGLVVTIANLWYSTLSWSMLSSPKFIFLKNYQRFFKDPIAVTSLINTFKYALYYVPPIIIVSLGLAMLLNKPGKLMMFFRTVYYVPVITSYVVVIVIWQWFFDYDIGLFNGILRSMGFEKVPWLLDKNLALPSIVFFSIWKNNGYSVMIFLSGLQTVDTNLYEAAMIDGAGAVSRFFHITLPQLKPTMSLAVVMNTTWAFQMFVQPYMLTLGGPDYATSTITYYMYQQAFSSYNIGYASAIAVLGVACFLIITSIEKWLFKEKEMGL